MFTNNACIPHTGTNLVPIGTLIYFNIIELTL